MNNDFFNNYTKKTTGETPKPDTSQDRPTQRTSIPPRKPDTARDTTQVATRDASRVSDPDTVKNSPPATMQRREPAGMNFEQKSDFRPPEPKIATANAKKPPVNLYIIIGAAAVVVTAVVLFIVLSASGTLTLPNMEGWSKSDADLWASDNGAIVRTVDEYSDAVEAGVIISQSPMAGEQLSPGSFLELHVSQGPDLSVLIPLPDIMNMTRQEIEAWTAENLMTKVRITSEYSETVPAGNIISFEVNDNTVSGSDVRRDSPVYVVVSNGSENTGPVEVPDFTTMTLDGAQKFADDNFITLTVIEKYDDTAPQGQIMSQSVKAETTINGGDTVEIVVSLGKEIIVPNFSTYEQDVAGTVAGQLGITISMTERYSTSDAGRLISQSIPAGTLYDPTDIVELTYSLGNEFLLSSFVGQTKESLDTWAHERNEQGANIKVVASYTSSSQPSGTILSQDKENVTIGINVTINVVVSQGEIIYVPDFISKDELPYSEIITREKAIAMCDEIGIVPVFTPVSLINRLEGEVVSQSIPPGTQIDQGSTITLGYIPVTSSLQVPDFQNMHEWELAPYGMLFELTFEVGEYIAGMEGRVISQTVRPDTVVAPGTAITVVIGGEEGYIPDPLPEEDSAGDVIPDDSGDML